MFEELLVYVAENFRVVRGTLDAKVDFHCKEHGFFGFTHGELEPGELELMRMIGEHMDEFHKDLLSPE